MKLGLENFRVFSEYQEFDLKPITILTGPNNSGKSTLHRAIYMMANSFKNDRGEIVLDKLSFDKINEKIGGFGSNLSFDNNSKKMKLSFVFKSRYLNNSFKIVLSYKGDKSNKNGLLTELEYFIKNEHRNNLLLFKIKNVPNWQFTEFNTVLFKDLLFELTKRGEKQETILALCTKMRKANIVLSQEEKNQIEIFKKEGLILNPGEDLIPKNNDPIDFSDPVNWRVYDLINKISYPYIGVYALAYKYFKTPIKNLLIKSDLLNQIQASDYFNSLNPDKDFEEINSLFKSENIFTQSDLINKYSIFENEIFSHLISDWNEFCCQGFSIDGVDIFPCEDLNGFVNNTFGVKEQIQYANLIFEPSPFAKYIIENQNWGGRLKFNDAVSGNFTKAYVEGSTNDSINGSVYFLNLFYNEFISEIKQFISRTKLLLFDTLINRHLLFDDSSKFQLTLSTYAKSKFAGSRDMKQESFIEKWLFAFNLGSSIEVDKILAGNEIIGAQFYIKAKDRKVQLGDNGMGTNQLLLLILQIATSQFGSRFLLEEPEASLHPAFQSLLAEMFVDAYKSFKHSFIIETHSEYLIRKLQSLTASQVISANDSQLYYFYHPDFVAQKVNQIKNIEINEDGMLSSDFGEGFFDEADRMAIDLYRLQRNKHQSN